MLEILKSHTISVGSDNLRYYILPDGKNYSPSVTTVLSQTDNPDKIIALKKWREREYNKNLTLLMDQGLDPHIAEIKARESLNFNRDAALKRGDAIHQALEYYATQKTKDPNFSDFLSIPVPEYARPYWAGLEYFIKTQISEFYLIEGFVYSNRGYSGRCDTVAKLVDGRAVLIDYKTSEKPRPNWKNHDYFVQLAAYVGAFNYTYQGQCQVDDGILLISRPHKKADIEELPKYLMLSYWDEWLRRLDQYYARIPHGSKGLPLA